MRNNEHGRASRFGVALAAILLLGAGDVPGALPSLNVHLRFVCLSLADDALGALEAHRMDQLPDAPRQSSLAVTTSWHSGTGVATSDVRDTLGNTLHVEESVGGPSLCEGVPIDTFRLDRVGDSYQSRICITPMDPNLRANVKVTMRLTGEQRRIEALGDRIFAIGSCLPAHGVDIFDAGVVAGRTIVRTLATN